MHKKNYYKCVIQTMEISERRKGVYVAICVAQERNCIPWKVVNDGFVSKDPKVVG